MQRLNEMRKIQFEEIRFRDCDEEDLSTQEEETQRIDAFELMQQNQVNKNKTNSEKQAKQQLKQKQQFLTPSTDKSKLFETQEMPLRSQSTPPIFVDGRDMTKDCPEFMRVFSARLTTSHCGTPISGRKVSRQQLRDDYELMKNVDCEIEKLNEEIRELNENFMMDEFDENFGCEEILDCGKVVKNCTSVGNLSDCLSQPEPEPKEDENIFLSQQELPTENLQQEGQIQVKKESDNEKSSLMTMMQTLHEAYKKDIKKAAENIENIKNLEISEKNRINVEFECCLSVIRNDKGRFDDENQHYRPPIDSCYHPNPHTQ